MKKVTITNNIYKVILLAFVFLNIVGGLFTFGKGVNLLSLASLVANIAILILYYTNNKNFKIAVKIGATLLIISTVTLLLPSGFIGILYGVDVLWKIVVYCVVMLVIGLHLYIGSNKFIQIENIYD